MELILYLPQVEFKKAVSGDFFAEKHTFISTFGMACPSIVLAIKPVKGATGASDIRLNHPTTSPATPVKIRQNEGLFVSWLTV